MSNIAATVASAASPGFAYRRVAAAAAADLAARTPITPDANTVGGPADALSGSPAATTAVVAHPMAFSERLQLIRLGFKNFAEGTARAFQRFPERLGNALRSFGHRVKDFFTKFGERTVRAFNGSPERIDMPPVQVPPANTQDSVRTHREMPRRHATESVHAKRGLSATHANDSMRPERDPAIRSPEEQSIRHLTPARHGLPDIYADDSIRTEYDLLNRLADASTPAKLDSVARYANQQILAAAAA